MSEDKPVGIIQTSEQYANMRKDMFVISDEATQAILDSYTLPEENQKKAVHKLVDRRSDWLELDEKEQQAEIMLALTLETVSSWLYIQGYIGGECTMYENYFDHKGNLVVNAFFVEQGDASKELEQAFKKEGEYAFEPTSVSEKVVSLSDWKERKEK